MVENAIRAGLRNRRVQIPSIYLVTRKKPAQLTFLGLLVQKGTEPNIVELVALGFGG